MSDFATLGLSAPLLRAAEALGFDAPTPIQAAAIPAVLTGRDVLGSAATGSGKTVAFAFPVLQRMDAAGRPALRRTHVLVLVPTRELAVQVGETFREIGRHLNDPIKLSVLYGGVSINPQMMALRGGADVVVATPGRLLDIVAQNALKLGEVDCLVLDEADRLLDAGFAEELDRVLALLPKKRQNLLFSATFPDAVQALTAQLLRDPIRVELAQEPSSQARIEEHAVEVDAAKRTPLLRHMIERGEWSRVLVFVATRYACDHVADKLRRAGLEAAAFHGDASQGARMRTLQDFKAGRIRVLIATDLGARGIDIAQLPVVVNYDLPRAAADYTHRIGRTARAGADGIAVSFISADTEAHFRLIENRQGRRVPRERIEGFEPKDAPADSLADAPSATHPTNGGLDPNGGIKGKRPSKKDKLRAASAEEARRQNRE